MAFSLLVALLVCGSYVPASAADRLAETTGLASALSSITVDELHDEVVGLIDERFEGRQYGCEGGHLAAQYLAEQLRVRGVVPAGAIDPNDPECKQRAWYQPFDEGCNNVIGMIPGSDPVLKNEYLLISAHYDHVGFGTKGGSRGGKGNIHPGADDNASGMAAVLETIEAIGVMPDGLRRSVIVAFWDAEEIGMKGSGHFVENPTVPLDQITMIVNFDMIGQVRDDLLTVFGTRTIAGMRELVSRANSDVGLRLNCTWSVIRNSDHWVFYQKDVPLLFFHSGLTEQYHTDRDTIDTLNFKQMHRVAQLAFRTIHLIDQEPGPIVMRGASKEEKQKLHDKILADNARPNSRLGIGWDNDLTADPSVQADADVPANAKSGVISNTTPDTGPGLLLSRVTPDSAGARAGLLIGDRIVAIDQQAITDSDQFVYRVMTAEQSVTLDVVRARLAVQRIAVPLTGQPMPIGLRVIADPGEPNCVTVGYVLPGSTAAEHDLKPDDRIYSVNGTRTSNVAQFQKLIRESGNPITLETEREGRIRTIQIKTSRGAV